MSDRDKDDCIVVMAPCCGRVIMAMVNNEHVGLKEKREIGDFVARGYVVEHKHAEEVRKLPFGCRCGK